ncbi:homoserine dehydrogenase [Citrus sinensis]|uniref:Homoserine dehydrogenase n=1 Tax=Citrus sinensis TaxID=2711 RepID=A0ACB8LK10_CITSI|nr:homoserine dehydrogenase [Citrus sinensis]
MATLKKIPSVLMGCGGVGRQLLQHIVSCRSLHANLGVHLRVVGVSDSKSLVVASDVFTKEFNDNLLSEICRLKADRSSLSTLISGFGGECQVFLDSDLRGKLSEIASLLGISTGLAFVDCSASSETVEILTQAVDLGCCIVLANKKPLMSTMEDYDKLVSRPRCIRYESTVGAGLPVIASLNRILSSGDPVHRIVGSLSGTLGYVMSKVEDGKPLSQVVKAAKSLGYTEPGLIVILNFYIAVDHIFSIMLWKLEAKVSSIWFGLLNTGIACDRLMTIEPKQLIGTCNYGGIPEFVVMKTPLLSFYEDNFHSCRGEEKHQWSSGRIAPCHGVRFRLVHVFLWPFCLLGHLSEYTISTRLRKSPAFLIHKTLGLSPDPYLVDVVQPSRQIASSTHFLILTSNRP